MRKRSRHVVIVGAGYGGLRTALDLGDYVARGGSLRVTLIDRNDYHTLVTTLHRVATDGLAPDAARLPLSLLLQDLPVEFRQGNVDRLDLEGQTVSIDGEPLPYDVLVVALGGRPHLHGIPGLEAQSLTVRTWQAAVETKRVIQAVASESDDPVVIGGGGYTGVEVAGELVDWLPEIAPGGPSPVLLELSNRLLPGFPADLARRIGRELRRKGVDVRLETGVQSVHDGHIELSTGERLRHAALIWTGGIRGPRILAEAGLRTAPSGRVPVDRYLRPRGLHNVFVIGDAAMIRDPIHNRPVAASAQMAVQEGETVAKTIAAMEFGDAPFAFLPRVLGEIVSIGRHDAIADIGPLLLGGRTASTMKEFALQRYLNSLGGVRILQEFDRRRFAATAHAS